MQGLRNGFLIRQLLEPLFMSGVRSSWVGLG